MTNISASKPAEAADQASRTPNDTNTSRQSSGFSMASIVSIMNKINDRIGTPSNNGYSWFK